MDNKVSYLKKFIKLLIITAFIIERVWYYKDLRAVETEVKDLHHEIVKGYEIDFGKINNKYETHHFFLLPFAKVSLNTVKEYLMHKTNLNQTIYHKKHIHAQDPTHSYQNKVIDVDMKFNFYFLTAYDLLICSLLVAVLYTDSYTSNIILLIDAGLKLLIIGFAHLNYITNSLYNFHIYNFIKNISKIDLNAMWEDLKNLYHSEKRLYINLILFGLLLILLFLNVSNSVRNLIWGKQNILEVKEVAKKAHKITEEIKHKMENPDENTFNKEISKSPKIIARQPEPEISENNYRRKQVNEVDRNRNRSRENTPSKRRQAKPAF